MRKPHCEESFEDFLEGNCQTDRIRVELLCLLEFEPGGPLTGTSRLFYFHAAFALFGPHYRNG